MFFKVKFFSPSLSDGPLASQPNPTHDNDNLKKKKEKKKKEKKEKKGLSISFLAKT